MVPYNNLGCCELSINSHDLSSHETSGMNIWVPSQQPGIDEGLSKHKEIFKWAIGREKKNINCGPRTSVGILLKSLRRLLLTTIRKKQSK